LASYALLHTNFQHVVQLQGSSHSIFLTGLFANLSHPTSGGKGSSKINREIIGGIGLSFAIVCQWVKSGSFQAGILVEPMSHF